MKKIIFLILMLFLLLEIPLAYAECERCSDSRLACTGDSERQVIEKCGQPTKTVPYENVFHEIVRVDHYYDLGSGKFIRVFSFKNGVLTGIGTLK